MTQYDESRKYDNKNHNTNILSSKIRGTLIKLNITINNDNLGQVMTIRLKIAEEFMRMPIGRGKGGTRGGEAFRIGHLYPKIKRAIENGEILDVDFTDMIGLDYSFLDEAFGGLVFEEKMDAQKVLETIKFLPEKSYFDSFIQNAIDRICEAGGMPRQRRSETPNR